MPMAGSPQNPSPSFNGFTQRIVALPSDKALASFTRCSISRTVRKGQQIISAGQTCGDVYFVDSGRVQRIGVDADGHEVVLDEYRPGEFFGIEALIWPRSRLQAVAAERSEIRRMPVSAFERLMRHEPELAVKLARMLAARVARCHSLLYEFAHDCLRERVLAALDRLAADHGVAHERGRFINYKLNQSELARMVGGSRPRVSLAIGQLIRAGRVARYGGGLVICASPQIAASAMPNSKLRRTNPAVTIRACSGGIAGSAGAR